MTRGLKGHSLHLVIWDHVYLFVIIVDLTLVAFACLAGQRFRWVYLLVMGTCSIPLAHLGFGAYSSAVAARTNADQTLAIAVCIAKAIPFLVCFIASALLFFLRRKRLTPQVTQGTTPTAA